MKRALIVGVVLLTAAAGVAALEQDFFSRRREPAMDVAGNQPYDGRVTFVRIR